MAGQLQQLEEAEEEILRMMEHAGSVADLLADMDGERREEVLEACQAFASAMENTRRILEQSIDGLPPEKGAHAHRDTYVAAAKLDLAADKAEYLQKRLSTIVGGLSPAVAARSQTDVTEEEVAAVAARSGFSFAVPLRSQPQPAAGGGDAGTAKDLGTTYQERADSDTSGAIDVHGGDDGLDNESNGSVEDDDDDTGSDIDDLDAMLEAEEAAAAAAAQGDASGTGGATWQ